MMENEKKKKKKNKKREKLVDRLVTQLNETRCEKYQFTRVNNTSE